MTIPGLIIGTLIGALIGTILHLLVGGHIGRLILYLIFGITGFWAGHLVADILGWTFFSYGPVHLGLAVIASLAVAGVGYWLSLVQTGKKPNG